MTETQVRKVPGPEGKLVEISFGDIWPLPYRGSKYSIVASNGGYRGIWKWQEYSVPMSDYPLRVHKLMYEAGKETGSVIVTSHGDILTKILSDKGVWIPKYLGEYANDFTFRSVDNNPTNLKMGEYWTGFPVHHGERWSVSPREDRGELMWKFYGNWFGSTKNFPELARQYKEIRQTGGRLYVNEYGQIWINVSDSDISDSFAEKFKKLQMVQVDKLISEGKDAILRLIYSRLLVSKVRPVYLGKISEYCGGEAPWVKFGSGRANLFGRGNEEYSDDGDAEEDD